MANTKRIAIEAADGWYVETMDYSYDPPKVIGNDGPYDAATLPAHDGYADDIDDI